MIELVQSNWPLFLIALVIGIVVAWWILVSMRRTSVATDRLDVLDEGKGPANRNQALIDSVPAAVVPLVSQAAAVPPVAVPQTTEAADDLSRIKGVGPKLKSLLISLGISRFDQIAAWSDADIDRIDAQLGRFEGRIRRDSWTEQAKLLAAEDMAGYEAKFGKL